MRAMNKMGLILCTVAAFSLGLVCGLVIGENPVAAQRAQPRVAVDLQPLQSSSQRNYGVLVNILEESRKQTAHLDIIAKNTR